VAKKPAGSRHDIKSKRLPAAAIPAAVPDDPNADLVYGAYQRGQYKTRVRPRDQARAGDRRPEGDDDARRTLRQCDGRQARDYAKAADWYKRAADSGDRGGHVRRWRCFASAAAAAPVNREEAVKLLASSAKLGNPKAGV